MIVSNSTSALELEQVFLERLFPYLNKKPEELSFTFPDFIQLTNNISIPKGDFFKVLAKLITEKNIPEQNLGRRTAEALPDDSQDLANHHNLPEITNLQAPWEPNCSDLTEQDLKMGGNCLFQAIRDALKKLNFQNANNMVFPLRRQLVKKLVEKLQADNTNIQETIEKKLNCQEQIITDLGLNLNKLSSSQVSLRNIAEATQISDINKVTNKEIRDLLQKLTGDNNNAITFPKNFEDKEILGNYSSEAQDANKYKFDEMVRKICSGLIEIKRLNEAQSQHPINVNILLNVVQNEIRTLKFNSTASVYDIIESDSQVLPRICKTYNEQITDERKIVIDENNQPLSEIKAFIVQATYIVLSQRNGSYLNHDDLQYISQIIGKSILLIEAEELKDDGKVICKNNEIQGSILYNPDLTSVKYKQEDIKLIEQKIQIQNLALTDTLVIIKTSTHFYAQVGSSEIAPAPPQEPTKDNATLPEQVGAAEGSQNSSDTHNSRLTLADCPVTVAETVSKIKDLFAEANKEQWYLDLEKKLEQFGGNFIPNLQASNKLWQAEAEEVNLKHIYICAEYMLTSMKFKPEFVAKIASERLSLVMFGLGKQSDVDYGIINPKINDDTDYQPSCMWDFGADRTTIPLTTGKYEQDGTVSSPSRREVKNTQKHTGNPFSLIRGKSENNTYYDYYNMPDNKKTLCLSNRFRQWLAHTTGDNNILSITTKDQPFLDLPPAMLFLVGLQFGQINTGTWNPFSLAAKKYLAFQFPSSNQFFWQENTEPNRDQSNVLDEAFGQLEKQILNEKQQNLPLEQFEQALCAYYAMNMEILSRANFNGNDKNSCTIQEIYRLEGLESLENLALVKQEDNRWVANNKGISEEIPRSVFVSSSANMFVTSLDKPKTFPPPIKVITKYKEVHHARIFGSHFFNVDFENAERKLPDFLRDKGQNITGKYNKGCPFFKDRQREFLMMPINFPAEVIGILSWAPQIEEYYIWKNMDLDQKLSTNSLAKETNNITLNLEVNVPVNTTEENLSDALLEGAKVCPVEKKRPFFQIKFDTLKPNEIKEFLSIFGKTNDENAFNDIEKYSKQLRAIKESYKLNTLYKK